MSATRHAWRYKLVAQALRRGAVIAYPTEGVWGLGCDPSSQEAVSRILHLKRRPWEQGLILAAGDVAQVAPWTTPLKPEHQAVLEASWPGPVTFIVPNHGEAPQWITGRHDTVAIRVSDHPVIRGICAEFRGPIVSTSANPSGKPPALSPLRLRQYFPGGVDMIVPGELGGQSGPSEIRELGSGSVLRPGESS